MFFISVMATRTSSASRELWMIGISDFCLAMPSLPSRVNTNDSLVAANDITPPPAVARFRTFWGLPSSARMPPLSEARRFPRRQPSCGIRSTREE